jgi:hypothetical protein
MEPKDQWLKWQSELKSVGMNITMMSKAGK